MTNLDPTATNYDQLMSCLEQNLCKEAGNLEDEKEQKLHDNMMDLSGPDPKSQAAINKLPADQRKRYNDATMKEFKRMQQKEVMKNVRINDVLMMVQDNNNCQDMDELINMEVEKKLN